MKKLCLAVVVSVGFSLQAMAQSLPDEMVKAPVDNTPKAMIQAKLAEARPGLKVMEVVKSPVEGLYKTTLEYGPPIYSSADGKFFLSGELFQLTPGEVVNLTQKDMNKTREKLMSAIKVKDTIVFSTKEEPKAVISIFTDVDCGYCAKLHREVEQMNALGIEVRYLAFPRAGVGSDSYNKMVSAWCAKDRQTAITKLKARESIPQNLCEVNPVAAQYNMVSQMGLTGTPAIILKDGELIPGYVPAAQLAARLGL